MNHQLQILLQQAIQAFQSGNFDSADFILKRVLQVDSKNLPALHILGLIRASQSKYKEAANYLALAARLNPNDASIHYNLAKALADSGNDKDALTHHKKAVALAPNNPEAWLSYGKTASNLGRHHDALLSYENALSLKPDYVEALLNKSTSLKELKRYEEAIALAEQALVVDPHLAEAWANKGVALNQLKRYDEAITQYDQALSLKPDYVEAWLSKGNVLNQLKRYDEAITQYDQALSLKPDYVEAWTNKGIALKESKRFEEAITHFDKALTLKPSYAEASWNKSLSLLLQGDFENGLPLYESRWALHKTSEVSSKRFFDKPTWLGEESLDGKKILLHFEQGLGDFIQFCRYVKLVADLGAKVILEVPRSLASLMKNLEDISELVIEGQELPFFDYQCPLLSLPLAFKTKLNTIPSPKEYITLNNHHDKTIEWKIKLGSKLRPRVGLVWSGNPHHNNDHNRSLLLRDLLPFLPNKFEYITLQKEVREVDKLTLDINPHVLSFSNDLNDFLDTAALIDQLDLVISVDTSVAHLSGALGKKTLLLLPYVPDWRWLLDREDSPWYPSIKLYRQPAIGDWNSVFDKVKFDLSCT
ncbi:tetratricopeptide repeat protein [Polynucleobacter sp. MG-Unter2-18]|uniref:tetratricopeptide repeat protein n=1 Tax=Polynucleobacter sp. MG-Unter2-18 TaxID=2081052 RepID=UPI001BFE1B54|nr:tetratricopeptide repeat protein [Polynucleobacter sp. MG-Unter2-18]QWD94697.1 tetratricopeptide repeat protein [Polynucleobacter sp. MG-Unter2-18]